MRWPVPRTSLRRCCRRASHSIFPVATTCRRWATRCSRAACWRFWQCGHDRSGAHISSMTSARCAKMRMDVRRFVMAREQTKAVNALDKVDPVWARIRGEAEEVVRREAELATFIYSTVLHHDTLEAAVVHRVTERLDHPDVSAELIRQAYSDALESDPSIGEAFRADIVATFDRDPATNRFLEPVLYFKGFHAIQTHRLAHWLAQGPQGFRLLSAEPLVGRFPDRHQPGRADRTRHLP